MAAISLPRGSSSSLVAMPAKYKGYMLVWSENNRQMLMRGKNGIHNNHSSHVIEELVAVGEMVVDPICPL